MSVIKDFGNLKNRIIHSIYKYIYLFILCTKDGF